MNNGYIDTFEFPISTGKEGNVFRARRKDELIAVKIYRINTATFRSISKYLMYEPPQKVKKDRRSIIFAWALKEFNNLKKLYNAGVRVPEPIAREGNVIVMEYIGTEEQPAPLLKDAPLENAEEVFEKIKKYLQLMFHKAELVHADFSEYNVLMHEGEPVIIDVGQTVSRDNPMAMEFLQRDVKNIVRFFKKYIEVDEQEVLKYILEG
ncbi:MAG TPA: serine protein kinase RIO [Thermoplasmatales archaeon]|nr:serine protein kinase RIO [Thermoplasmatales archaeon]